MKKIKYEKPMSIDAGQVAAVQGASCSGGDRATDGCRSGEIAINVCSWGNNPSVIPYCPAGNIATGNCASLGGTAGESCHTGNSPGW